MSKRKLLSNQRQPSKLFKPRLRKNSRQSSDYLNKMQDKDISFQTFKSKNNFKSDIQKSIKNFNTYVK